MADIPRLNGIIRALEQGRPAFTAFSPAEVDSAFAFATSKYDGVVFEMEHNPWDARALRDGLQYLLNRRQIAQSGSLAPSVTPLVRMPVNGVEKAQWHAKQALDLGCYGIVWPHISTVEEAYNAVAACRYPRLKTAPRYEPAGIRGDGPTGAVRYWGLTQQEYYAKADVWPLDPGGEILVVLQIEDMRGVDNLDDDTDRGEGDRRDPDRRRRPRPGARHPAPVRAPGAAQAMARVVETCRKHNVVVGHPHVEAGNAERLIKEGYRFLMCAPTRSYGHLDKARQIAGLK